MIRRVAALLFSVALAWLCIGTANAALPCSSQSDKCTKSQAYAAAMDGSGFCALTSERVFLRWDQSIGEVNADTPAAYFRSYPRCGTASSSYGYVTQFYYTTGCPAGQQWNGGTGNCQASCSSRPSFAGIYAGDAGSCQDGCQFVPNISEGGITRYQVGDKIFTRASVLEPTGSVCTASPDDVPPDSDACVTQGALTQCVRPDGQLCAVASSGKKFCWEAGENGIKASGNDAATKSPQGKEAKPPPLPPNNGGEWEQQGQSTVIESKDGKTSTSNVTSWGSSYGSKGQGASGGGASGEGKGGSGSGSGLGNGSGNGDGDGEGDGAGPPGSAAGDLYTANGKTVASVFSAFRTRVGESPLIGAVQGFFTVHGGGACPTFTVSASAYWESMTYDAHCSGEFLSALRAIGWVLMAIAALAAAYWALS